MTEPTIISPGSSSTRTAPSPKRGLLASISLGCSLLFASPANAEDTARGDTANGTAVNATGAAACGDIQVRSDMKCTLEAKGSCTAKCSQGARFSVACEARCAGRCSASADAACRTDCKGSCNSDCTATPVDCSAHCNGGCTADCSSHCDAGDSACTDKCTASCDVQCTAKCNARASDSCADSCEASCEGICSARANVDCDFDCDAACRADLKGSCEASCTGAHAALFCDGQFISVGTEDAKSCTDYLVSAAGVKASLSVSCSGNTCTGTAAGETTSVSAPKCSVASIGGVSGNSRSRNGMTEAAGLFVVAALALRRGRIQARRP